MSFGVEPGGRDVQTITEAYIASFPRAAQAVRGVPPPERGADPLAEPAGTEPLAGMSLAPARPA